MFKGVLSLPGQARELLGWTKEESTITGNAAMTVMSVAAGVIASFSEFVDIFDGNTAGSNSAGLSIHLTELLRTIGIEIEATDKLSVPAGFRCVFGNFAPASVFIVLHVATELSVVGEDGSTRFGVSEEETRGGLGSDSGVGEHDGERARGFSKSTRMMGARSGGREKSRVVVETMLKVSEQTCYKYLRVIRRGRSKAIFEISNGLYP